MWDFEAIVANISLGDQDMNKLKSRLTNDPTTQVTAFLTDWILRRIF